MSKKIRLALGLESDTPPAVPEEGQQPETTNPPTDPVNPPTEGEEEPDEFESAEEEAGELVQESDELNDAGDEVAQTIVTLERIDTILAGSPEDQINETTAMVIDAAMQDIAGRFDIEKAPELSAESFRSAGSKSYRDIAREDVGSKMEAFKNGLKNIATKIIELMQKFWQWLTVNHKRVKETLATASNAISGVNGDAEITMKEPWRHVMKSETFSISDSTAISTTLLDLCVSAQGFVMSGFNLGEDAKQTLSLSSSGSMEKLLSKFFTKYASSNRAGLYLLYSDIGDRTLRLDISSQSDAKTASDAREPFKTELVKNEKRFHSPETIKVKSSDVVTLLAEGNKLVDASEKEFDKINRLQSSLKSLSGKEGSPNDTSAIFRSYNKCLSAFINGVFIECLRYANAAASIATAYSKNAVVVKD